MSLPPPPRLAFYSRRNMVPPPPGSPSFLSRSGISHRASILSFHSNKWPPTPSHPGTLQFVPRCIHCRHLGLYFSLRAALPECVSFRKMRADFPSPSVFPAVQRVADASLATNAPGPWTISNFARTILRPVVSCLLATRHISFIPFRILLCIASSNFFRLLPFQTPSLSTKNCFTSSLPLGLHILVTFSILIKV